MSTNEHDVAATLNSMHIDNPTWASAMGITFVRATPDEVVAELEIGPQHRQPFGIVHGGVHAGVIETLASIGAALVAAPRGQAVVGLENHSTFVRAARSGRLRATATPITVGRTTQVWEATVRDAQERILATGRVRLLCVDATSQLAGGAVEAPGQRGG
jgi:1,4-dihydroxy-2-naphthoyl-CoA hydrolase